VADVGQRWRYMDHSVTFARHYARLLWLVLHEPANVDEQKASLRALVTVSKDRRGVDGGQRRFALGERQRGAPAPTPACATSRARWAVMAWPRWSSTPVPLRRGSSARRASGRRGGRRRWRCRGACEAAALGAPACGSSRGRATPVGAARVAPASGRAASRLAARAPLRRPPAPPQPSGAGALPDFGLGDVDVLDEEAMQAKLAPTPRANVAIPASARARGRVAGCSSSSPRAARRRRRTRAARAARSGDGGERADARARRSRGDRRGGGARRAPALVCEILCRVTRREPQIHEFESKRAFVMAQRRSPSRSCCARSRRSFRTRAIQRDAFIAGAGASGRGRRRCARSSRSRRSRGRTSGACTSTRCCSSRPAIPTLIHMLGDARWFVARNAAELLGEMQARESRAQLTELLRHTDDRVRRAATSALMRLGTTRAMNAIQEALKDGAPAMRMQAAAALVTRKDVKTAATLVRALEEEKDEEVAGRLPPGARQAWGRRTRCSDC
jgi:hypothetical protein